MLEQSFHPKFILKYFPKYLRYTAHGRNGSVLKKTGLFHAAYQLQGDNSLPAAEQKELSQCLLWFQRHVRLASIDELSDLDQQALCWYKNPDYPEHVFNHAQDEAASKTLADNTASNHNDASAQEALTQTEELARIMRRHGFFIQVERTNQPGVIISEDDIQVAAIPAQNVWIALRLRLQLWWQRNVPQFA